MVFRALTASEDEKKLRLASLKRFASKFTLTSWSNEIMERFEKEAHRIASTPPTTFLNFEELAKAYKNSKNRALFLDYDVHSILIIREHWCLSKKCLKRRLLVEIS